MIGGFLVISRVLRARNTEFPSSTIVAIRERIVVKWESIVVMWDAIVVIRDRSSVEGEPLQPRGNELLFDDGQMSRSVKAVLPSGKRCR